MTNYRDAAFLQIDEQVQSASLFRAAVRLLLNVSGENGLLRATRQHLCDLVKVRAWNSARSVLSDLAALGILGYQQTGDEVIVWFLAWPVCAGSDQPRSESDHRRSDSDHAPEPKPDRLIQSGSPVIQIGSTANPDDDDVIQNGSSMIQSGSTNDRVIQSGSSMIPNGSAVIQSGSNDPALSSKLVGSNVLERSGSKEPLEPTNLVQVSPDQYERSVALLADPAIMALVNNPKRHSQKIREYAEKHAFDWLMQQVAAWWCDVQAGRVRSAGALHSRIERTFRLEPYDPAFLASDLYRRHYPLTSAMVRARAYSLDPPRDWIAALPAPVFAEEVRDALP